MTDDAKSPLGSDHGTDPVLRIEGLPHQTTLWGDYQQDAQLAIVGPYGCGKTMGLAVKAYILANANRGFDGMLVVPTYNLFRLVHFNEWPSLFENWGIELRWNGSDYAWTWPWGDKLWVRSAEKPDRMTGPNLAYILGDEPGQWKKQAWERASVRPRAPGAPLRQTVLGGTPEGINWFADEFNDPEELDPEVAARRRTIWARHWHPDMSYYYAHLLATYGYDESLIEAYIEGKFVPLRKGRCYRHFDPAKHLVDDVPYNPNLPLIIGADFNVDQMSWQVVQIAPEAVYVHEELALGAGSDTEKAAIEFKNRWASRHFGHVIVTGDATGNNRSTTGKTDYRIARQELKSDTKFASVTTKIPKANPLQKDRVDNMNYHLSGRGARPILVHKKNRRLKRDWERVSWIPGTGQIDKNSDLELTHSSDGLDYVFWTMLRAIAGRGKTGRIVPGHTIPRALGRGTGIIVPRTPGV